MWSTADWTQVAQFTNHSSSVNTVSISNDSKFVVSGSGDRLATSAGDTTVRVWNQQTQKQISVFHGHNTSATAVAFDPSTKCVVSGTDEGRICVWNRDTGDLIADLLDEVVELPDGPIPIADGIIVDLKFDQNGTEVISIDEDTTLMRWNARTGTAIRRFRVEVDNKYPVLCAKLFPEVNQCAISLWSTDVILANLSGNPSASRFTGTPCQIDSIAWSPDGRNIAGYCQDGKIRIWHRQSMLDDMKLNGHTENITCLAFSDDGQQIASGGFDERIMLWCPETGVLTKEIENTGMVGFLTFTHDGLGLVSVAFDTEIRLWDLKAGILVASSVKLTQRIKLLSVCPADRFVAALTEDGMIVLWNPSTPTPTSLQSIESEGVNYDSLCFSKDGRHLIASQGDKATEWDLEESDPHPIVSNEALSRADRELPEKYFLFPRDSVNCLLLEMSKGDTVAVFPAFFLISKSYPPDSRWAVANGRHVMILELVEEIVEDIETIEIIDSFPEFDPPNF
ncbi:WD40 repeat domain-containing protein [uncultured Rubinisphaera sp.]|uniref:WD40 repeat domain-containing protein n=1 Tax=uncultured Rubinisphaera sp. TaxID=1678686 RepID=UPI0030DA74DA